MYGIKNILILAIIVIAGVVTAKNDLKAESWVKMPKDMKNCVYYEYSGIANLWGFLRGSWVVTQDNGRAKGRCTNIEGNDCPLYSEVKGNYKVVYTNPNNITQCYIELEQFIRENHPQDLDLSKAIKEIKSSVEEANTDNPEASNDVNGKTVTRSIRIVSF